MNDDMPPGLSHAGAVIDRAIEHLVERNTDGLAIASALLGATLSMLGRTLDDDAVAEILDQAAASVRRGELARGE